MYVCMYVTNEFYFLDTSRNTNKNRFLFRNTAANTRRNAAAGAVEDGFFMSNTSKTYNEGFSQRKALKVK